jgi:hypothetical protein
MMKFNSVNMNHSEVIETIGSITKMEGVISVEQNILENSLVLKSVDPFPGFHKEGRNFLETKSESIFIILKNKYAPEKINALNRELSNLKIIKYYPCFGEIITEDAIFPCIRLKGIENPLQIPIIQEYYKMHEFELMPYQKIRGSAKIKIFTTFKIIEISNGLYRDLNNGNKIYIRIPKSLSWKSFDSITKKIKYNLKGSNFDSALGIIYRFCGPEAVIRVYQEEKTLEKALLIKKMYLKEIKNDAQVSAQNLQFY